MRIWRRCGGSRRSAGGVVPVFHLDPTDRSVLAQALLGEREKPWEALLSSGYRTASLYALTPDGLRFPIFYAEVHDGCCCPLMASDQPQARPPPAGLRTIDRGVTLPSQQPACRRCLTRLESCSQIKLRTAVKVLLTKHG